MRLHRMQPPVAFPIDSTSMLHGLLGLFRGSHYSEAFDREMKLWFGVAHIWKVSSGKAALVLALRALSRLSPGKTEVVIPAYTCFSVPSAVVKAGFNVVPCDVNQSTLDYDFDKLQELIGENTLCVISCHLFGRPSDTASVKAMCKRLGVFVVEDAAQAMGIVAHGTKLGTQADVGIFSLGRGKCITSGAGGIIVANSQRIAEALDKEYRSLPSPSFFECVRSYLSVVVQKIFTHPLLFWLPAGIPQLRIGATLFEETFPVKRLSGMAAGLLWNWRERLDRANRGRDETARYFAEHLPPANPCVSRIPYLRFPILLATRKQKQVLMALPEARELGLNTMYPTGVGEIPQLAGMTGGRTYPVASDVAQRLVTLPTHYLLTDEDKERICALIGKVFRESSPLTPDNAGH